MITITRRSPPLILGSSSPRRQHLLDAVGIKYQVVKPQTPEVPLPLELPATYAQRNASEKAAWVTAMLAPQPEFAAGFVVLAADTIVVLGDDILEKPRDQGHAAEMLQRLSGQTHTVLSGVTLQAHGTCSDLIRTFCVATQVRIKELSPAEIAAYIRTGEPLDKAGGYGAQGIGSYMVEHFSGSYTNVVGLPVAEVVRALEESFGYPLWEL